MSLFSLVNKKDRRGLKRNPLAQEILGPYNKGNEPFDTPYTYGQADAHIDNEGILDKHNYHPDPIGLRAGLKGATSKHAPIFDSQYSVPSRISTRNKQNWGQVYKVPWNSKTNTYDPTSTDRRFFPYDFNTSGDIERYNRSRLNTELHMDVNSGFNLSDSLTTQEVYNILESDNIDIKFNNEAYGKYLK